MKSCNVFSAPNKILFVCSNCNNMITNIDEMYNICNDYKVLHSSDLISFVCLFSNDT